MHRRHVLSALALVVTAMLASGRPIIATVVGVGAGGRDHDHNDHNDHNDHDADCERVTTTGRATVRRRCDGTRAHASVDNRITVKDPRVVRKTHERPIDRVRARGEGRIHATGDKGARREMHKKAHRRH
jgi:hypothetical protein